MDEARACLKPGTGLVQLLRPFEVTLPFARPGTPLPIFWVRSQ
jgi:hypothetical protein